MTTVGRTMPTIAEPSGGDDFRCSLQSEKARAANCVAAGGDLRFDRVKPGVSMQKRAYGLEVPQGLQDLCDPSRLGLLVYDMQAGILAQLADAEAVTARAAAVLRAARRGGYRVFFSRHLSLPVEVSGVAGMRAALAWQRVERIEQLRPAFPRDAPQSQIVPEVAPRASEAVFDKIAMSAFVGSPLEIALRDCRLSALALVGVALEVGIEPTARHAADLGLIPVVVADACGGRDEAAMERALAGLAFAGDAILTDASTLCPLLAGAGVPDRGAA
jgi:nicotinamidase-related amidase